MRIAERCLILEAATIRSNVNRGYHSGSFKCRRRKPPSFPQFDRPTLRWVKPPVADSLRSSLIRCACRTVGIVVNPLDENFCRLETAHPGPPGPSSAPLYELHAALILGEGRATGAERWSSNVPSYSSHSGRANS